MATTKFLLLLFIYLVSTSKAHSSQSNITTGSTLHTNSTPNFWPSPSGHFVFGFFPSGNGFKVGIWLVGTPTNIIVWTARRRDPVVSSGAALAFSTDGRLLLRSGTGEVQLIAESNQTALYAAMLDSGNFVLYKSNLELVWNSFDYPTDTLLIGQKLVQGRFLCSSVSETNKSIGNFKLLMQRDGNLNAFPVTSTLEGRYIYWSSNSNTGSGKYVSLNLDQDGRLYLQNSSTGFIVMNITEGRFSVNKTTLYRATFDVDGILRLYQHQIGPNGSLNSKILWEMLYGEDRCLVKGACGLNSYCSLNGADIACFCPPGFHIVDPKQPLKGCQLNFTINDCSEINQSNNKDFVIYPLEHTYWERSEYDVIESVSEEACSENCLEDCNCVVAEFRDQLCFKYKLPLRYGRKISRIITKTLIKIRIGGNPSATSIEISNKKLGKEFVVVGVVLIAFSLIVFMSIGHLIYTNNIWSHKIITSQASPSDVIEEINLRSFSYDQLVLATDNFKEEIGRGASGRVYKGTLGMNGEKEIAVKRLEKLVEDGEREFRNEMKIIGRTHHKYLVHLIGFCSEGSNKVLVYEYMKNGSLGDLLFKAKKHPSWSERRRIALEIAKGLHYLHEECETKIIHCDIKPHNILMDESWTVKISDFGLSKLLKPDQTRTYTMPRGTRGYAAPEWHNNNTPITVKADVYSFGVMLLEIISCRKNMDISLKDDEIILMDWVHQCYEAGELRKLVDEEGLGMEDVEKMVKIGLQCVETDFNLRPTMKQVILTMEGIVVTVPPPSSYSSVSG